MSDAWITGLIAATAWYATVFVLLKTQIRTTFFPWWIEIHLFIGFIAVWTMVERLVG